MEIPVPVEAVPQEAVENRAVAPTAAVVVATPAMAVMDPVRPAVVYPF